MVLERESCLNESQRTINFDKIFLNVCSAVFVETNFIARKMNYLAAFRDLFMEQIFFCGFLGFSEFLRKDYLTTIMSWQSSSGCFLYNGECSNHMSGVAAGLIALSLKLASVQVIN